MELRPDQKRDEFDLLYAKTLEESGDTEGALESYSEIVKSFRAKKQDADMHFY